MPTPPDTLTLLEKLTLTEVSGVDAPANMLPGWMVQKQRNGVIPALAIALGDGDDEALLKMIEHLPATPQDRGLAVRTDSAAAVPPSSAAADTPSAPAVSGGFFQPARNVYRRIF